MERLRVLVLARSYPNAVMPTLGLWVRSLVEHTSLLVDQRVIAAVPYCPPLPQFVGYARFRRIAREEHLNGITVSHPRFLTGPGYSLHGMEAGAYYLGVRATTDRLHREFPFDLIHAHFSYPDGVVAVRLGQRHRVPVVITEHAPWTPWMDRYPRVRRQAVWAARRCAIHIAVSRHVRQTIIRFAGDTGNVHVLPVGVDESLFSPTTNGRDHRQILYVGFINFTKGVDVLLHAMRRLRDHRSDVRLILVGGAIYRHTRRQEAALRRLAGELGLQSCVQFVGIKPPHEVAAIMRDSALLVLPSRAESFGAVLVEALASGIPVVATRCGGPEDIVTDEVGLLVPPDDPEALSRAVADVLDHHAAYDPARLRRHAMARYSWGQVARQTVDLYHRALADPQRQSGEPRP